MRTIRPGFLNLYTDDAEPILEDWFVFFSLRFLKLRRVAAYRRGNKQPRKFLQRACRSVKAEREDSVRGLAISEKD